MISRTKGIAVFAAAFAAATLVPTSAQASTTATYAEFFDNANYCCSSFYDPGDGGRCFNLPTYFQKTISSVRSNTRWILFSRINCWADSGAPSLDRTGDVSYVGDQMNDKTLSVKVF
ncbi:hypothetical protein [Amycolatopsis sp.]|uniref:hypothetical protein n=1 Tax=Amycolatopsis sp. TaxID=37632 RepID=UPI002D8012E9|nr:hypothetical protein [Amycolatopsis sp.]HET6711987.1 hypothetical protein [Amycolatopsis sp.]